MMTKDPHIPFHVPWRIFLLGSLLCSFLALSFTAPQHTHAAAGKNLVLVGGGLKDDNAAVYNRIVDLAGGAGVARIGVITAASIPPSQDPNAGTPNANNSVANGQFYANLFKGTYHAADAQWIPIDLDNISSNASQTVVDQLNSMTGFFFGGGDQTRLITCFYLANRTDSPALAAIRTKYANGAVIAGTSAGTEVESGYPMITGGESYEAVRYGSYTSIDPNHPDDLSYDPQGGFNIFKYGLVDAHFSERGRQGRMMRLAWDTSQRMAYGVDENTAMVVTNVDTGNAQIQVLGPGGVTIIDLAQASRGNGSYWSIYDVKVTYLTQGDTYNPNTKQATIAGWKTSLAGREAHDYAMSPPDDIFSSPNNRSNGNRANPREFVTVATDLFDSRYSSSNYGATYEANPTFEVRMTKSSSFGSKGYQGYQGNVNYYAYTNLKVDVFRY